MWHDFSLADAAVASARPPFAFPDAVPGWQQLWRAVVHRVAVTPDNASKDALLDSFASSRGVRTLGFVNAHALNNCVSDPEFAADLLSLDHLVRDGIGVHSLYRLIGAHSGLNLNGTDLLPDLIKRFAGQRIALFGTQQHLVEKVGARLRHSLRCDVITADGFQPDGHYLEQVAQQRPALVILGMGMPKQERVARLMKHGLHQDAAIVCGGAILDFLSGHRSRAPHWMRRAGLEWLYRLGLEPKRLFRRYVIGNPMFLLRSALLTRPKPIPRAPMSTTRHEPPPFGIGGPLPANALAILADPPVVTRAAVATLVGPATVVVRGPAASEFAANRPVLLRDDLFGRADDLYRLLDWVLDQRGNALIYGPRGYGKTSLVRVLGDVADSLGHVVLYASSSRSTDFDALMRLYLSEIPGIDQLVLANAPTLDVERVAALLASVRDTSLIIILDEFDRIERADTRASIVELIKDVSDIAASVRFMLVGVATDVTSILGFHPSLHRCITCVPLTRLADDAVDALLRSKAAGDGLDLPDALRGQIVALSAGSAYHAQLIGQKLVARARRLGCQAVTATDLDRVIGDIVSDAALMDASFARLTAMARRAPAMLAEYVRIGRVALADAGDIVRLGAGDPALTLCAGLADDGVLQPVSDGVMTGWRFSNAFVPQLLLMLDHSAAANG